MIRSFAVLQAPERQPEHGESFSSSGALTKSFLSLRLKQRPVVVLVEDIGNFLFCASVRLSSKIR